MFLCPSNKSVFNYEKKKHTQHNEGSAVVMARWGGWKEAFPKEKARETHFLNCVKSAIFCNLCKVKAKARQSTKHAHIYKPKPKAYASKNSHKCGKSHTNKSERESSQSGACSLSSGAICFGKSASSSTVTPSEGERNIKNGRGKLEFLF